MDEIKPNPAAERERERFISSHDIGCIFSYSKVIWLFVYNSCVLQQWDTKNKPWGCHPPCLIKLMMVKACDKLVELSNVSISVKICEDLLRSVKICYIATSLHCYIATSLHRYIATFQRANPTTKTKIRRILRFQIDLVVGINLQSMKMLNKGSLYNVRGRRPVEWVEDESNGFLVIWTGLGNCWMKI